MAKKIFMSLAIIMLTLCCLSVCFAADNNSNVNLGDELTRSLDKTEDSVENVTGDVMNGITSDTENNRNADNRNNNMNNDDTINFRNSDNRNNSMNNNNTNNYNTNGNNRNNNNTDNNVFTEGYNAVRTSVDEITTGNMSTTTWVWIILAVAAIIIVAMVWYYAVQDNRKD